MLRPRAGPDEDTRRRLLFGERGGGGGGGGLGLGDREGLEAANDEAVEGLRGRVGDMRHLALDIDTELGEQNAFLDGMSGTFDGAGSALGKTMRDLRRLANSGGSGHMCVLFLFAFTFFVLVYLLFR